MKISDLGTKQPPEPGFRKLLVQLSKIAPSAFKQVEDSDKLVPHYVAGTGPDNRLEVSQSTVGGAAYVRVFWVPELRLMVPPEHNELLANVIRLLKKEYPQQAKFLEGSSRLGKPGERHKYTFYVNFERNVSAETQRGTSLRWPKGEFWGETK